MTCRHGIPEPNEGFWIDRPPVCPWCKIDELKAELKDCKSVGKDVCKDREAYINENQRLRNALETAWERMDRARKILTDGKPSKHNNWGMLDTTLDRQALEKKI